MTRRIRTKKEKPATEGFFGMLPDWKIDTQAFRDEDDSRAPAHPPVKKNAAWHKKTDTNPKNSVAACSDNSLSEFLEHEPNLYSLSDLKARYK
jgi:hypothetical protein